MRRRALLRGLAAASLAGPRLEAALAPSVKVGLEQVVAQGGGPLRKRKVGLLAHAAAVTLDGRHAIDALRASGVDVVRLFGPEHGLRGRGAAGEGVASGVDEASGLPVVSLYGVREKPSPEDLRGLDALVVDLQDAGVRFYTYSSTMLLALEAAAESGLEAVVLDRPNPLGGERVEGPERDAGMPFSLVGAAPGPLVHGLTLGEMARFTNARRAKPGQLSVIPMAGWRRRMSWTDTARPWVDPSPNLRSAEAAIAYPGTCLVEATNASEGRGTESPFLLIGAPWVKPETLVREAATAGFALEPARFTPVASAAAPRPKLLGAACLGVRVHVTDASAAEPYPLGLRLLQALRRHQEFAWERAGAWLDTLSGTKSVRASLERGLAVEAILARQAPAIERWRGERKSALLYS